ncbi:MAG TPA: hypothetical protein VHN16_06770 [Streptosporangiaceae bacterium]|nr:hypothetical protein [Streptosporangiaceae bacterium]
MRRRHYVSESRGEDQPGSSSSPGDQPASSGANRGQPRTSSQPGGARSDSPPRGNGKSGSRNQSGRGSDPVADFQRWLMKAGARSMANQVADQVKKTIGQERRRDRGDVWDTATTELPPDEPLECQWCPVCQAARAARLSGPGLGARLTGAGGVLASVVQDAFSAFEQAMKTQDQNHSAERTVVTPPTTPDRGEAAP